MTTTPTRVDPVSPDELHQLAARADELRRDVATVWARMRAADEATGYAGARLDDVVDELRRIGELFDDTLVDLNRIHGRPRCPVAWGICATDGRSLVESGGGTDCTGDCGQHWEHLRLSEPCREPGRVRGAPARRHEQPDVHRARQGRRGERREHHRPDRRRVSGVAGPPGRCPGGPPPFIPIVPS